MDKIFLQQYITETTKLLSITKNFGLDVDFRDIRYIQDLCVAYLLWPNKVYWKEVFSRVLEVSQEDISDLKTLNKVKQWTNRHFAQAIKDGLISKTHSLDDKRVVVFEWSPKGIELMERIFKK